MGQVQKPGNSSGAVLGRQYAGGRQAIWRAGQQMGRRESRVQTIRLAPRHLQAIAVPVEEASVVAGKQLFVFYAWQNRPGVDELPSRGPTDFKAWLQALAKTGDQF